MPAPSAMPNLAAWFVGGVGITSAGGLVSQWNDQSGNTRHLKQATGASQPALQADGSILFDGVDDFLKCDPFTLNQPETIYLFCKQITWTAFDSFCDGNAINTGRIQQNPTASPAIRLLADDPTALSTLPLNTYGVLLAVINGANSFLQINSTVGASANEAGPNMGGFTLGADGSGLTSFSNIQVKEVAIFSVAHDAPTRAGVIAYLNGSEAQAAARNIGGGPIRTGYRFTPYIPRRFPKKKTR